ncbi:hypothetical protein DFJ58DRAFT_735395 [Suillus subalutaceus]|uniref:uncharacterized protein n=1 Tax=Suillus subalutaceus TaxID=48586 RepID=UPI001B87D03B|nr:uncharacterized protein DFJ58DRAFT_735395 [Suillus subalutaceus]KAG1835881.1 hypothetical protein DFJ58DRAFT_735395 [Suillus subalutaceus]
MPQRQDLLESNTEFDPESSSESNSDDSDEELVQVRTAIAPASVDAMPQELHQFAITNRLSRPLKCCCSTCGRYWETMKRNALLEVATSKGCKRHNLTPNDLAMAAKEDTIRALGRKYSITHCLWINIKIFPLHTCPDINLNSKEHWISGVSMEDGVKAELFQFIPAEEHELMNYHSFGSQFRRGVSNACSEMASDVGACANAIFSLSANIFIWGYKRHENPGCRALLLSPHGDYTKFALVLFPTPERPVPNEMLKSAKLVQVLKVLLFGKSSLAATGAASSRTKAKIWKLRATISGMIAAAAVAIFLLSGDTELTEIGETTKIPYHEYHNFFHQRLLTGGPCAHQVLLFFNDALFSTSSSVPPSAHDDGPGHMYEEEFERAMEQELEGPVFNADRWMMSDYRLRARTPGTPDLIRPAGAPHSTAPLNHPPAALTVNAAAAPTIVDPPVSAPPVPAPPVPAPSESISTAMGDLNLGNQDVRLGIEHLSPVEINNAHPKPKPKPRRKAQTADNLVIAKGSTVDSTHSAVGSVNAQTTQRSGRKAK